MQERVGELLGDAERQLREAGIDQPRREARLLLAHALGLEPAGLLSLGAQDMVEAGPFAVLVRRRAERVPLAYLTGRQGFWTLDLLVSADTLIPRADSETLIEALLQAQPDRSPPYRMLDLGTGTGCLLLAALSEYPAAWGLGIDLSPGAAALAASNAVACGLDRRSAMLCGDWDASLPDSDPGFDVVLSNPPYIRCHDIATLMPEVAAHEPARALDGGPDGLDAYRALMPVLERRLAPGGLALLEAGIGQADAIAGLGAAQGLVSGGTRRDLGGVERAVMLRRPV